MEDKIKSPTGRLVFESNPFLGVPFVPEGGKYETTLDMSNAHVWIDADSAIENLVFDRYFTAAPPAPPEIDVLVSDETRYWSGGEDTNGNRKARRRAAAIARKR